MMPQSLQTVRMYLEGRREAAYLVRRDQVPLDGAQVAAVEAAGELDAVDLLGDLRRVVVRLL